MGPDNDCDSLGLCTIENVEVECGDQTGTLRKRDLGSNQLSSRISLSISFDLKVPLPENTTEADLNQTTEEISSNLLLKFNRTDVNLNISGISLVFDASKPPQVRFVRLLCDNAQILRAPNAVSRVCYHQIPKNLKKQSDWLTNVPKRFLFCPMILVTLAFFYKRVF